MIEDIEDRNTVEGLVCEREGAGLAQDASGRGPVEHRPRVVEADPGTVREVTCELSLAAADVEHPGEALGDEAPSDQFVNVWCRRVAAEHRAREAHAAGILIVVRGDGLGRSLPGVVIFQEDLPFPPRSGGSTSDGERDHRQQQVKARQKPKEASNTSAKERANILGR
jgi:hypothetical protein